MQEKDRIQELENYYILARRAISNEDLEKASEYYKKTLEITPDDYESNFYLMYCEVKNCRVVDIEPTAKKVSKSIPDIICMIKNNVKPDSMNQILDEIVKTTLSMANFLYNSAVRFYNDYPNYFDGGKTKQEWMYRCCAARDICYTCGNAITKELGEEYGKYAAICWEQGIEHHRLLFKDFVNKEQNKQMIEEYSEKVKKYNPDFVAPILDLKGKPKDFNYVGFFVFAGLLVVGAFLIGLLVL